MDTAATRTFETDQSCTVTLVTIGLVRMHMTVRSMMRRKAPGILRQVENEAFGTPGWRP